MRTVETCSGVGLGGVLAVLCSWLVNHSVGWAILHLFCGWIYVVYALICHGKALGL